MGERPESRAGVGARQRTQRVVVRLKGFGFGAARLCVECRCLNLKEASVIEVAPDV